MRKILLITMLCLATTFSMAVAQTDCKFCGIWVGEYTALDMQFQIRIKIKKDGNKYHIRMKRKCLNTNDYSELGACQITSFDEKSISWQINGQRMYDADNDEYYSLHNSFTINIYVTVLYLTETGCWYNFYHGDNHVRHENAPILLAMKNLPLFKKEDDF